MSRVGWDLYFMRIATEVSSRATCDRRHVGALLVLDNVILATGYNGSLRGQPHCDDVGHLMIEGHCERTVHAEANAVAQSAARGVAVTGATLYVTTYPCFTCFKLVTNAGIRRVVYASEYKDRVDGEVYKASVALGLELVRVEVEAPPVDAVLFCPNCQYQHVDSPEPATGWNNPPHKSHLCANCKHVWRPADVYTNGVLFIRTRGKNDT